MLEHLYILEDVFLQPLWPDSDPDRDDLEDIQWLELFIHLLL